MKVLRIYMFDTPSTEPAAAGMGIPSIQVEGLQGWSNEDLARMTMGLGMVLYSHRGDAYAAAQDKAMMALVGGSTATVQEQLKSHMAKVLEPEPVTFVYDPSAEGGEE